MTEAKKFQLRGNCQCCGRDHAVLGTGRMAKHGYEVKDGYFKGVCHGDGYAPIQKERKQADSIIAQVRDQGARELQTAGRFERKEIHPLVIKTNRYNPVTRSSVEIPWAEGSDYQKEEARKAAQYACESRSRAAYSWADSMSKIVELYHGQALREVPVEAPPEAIISGEKQNGPRGVYTVRSVDRGMVSCVDPQGFRRKITTRAWRLLPKVA